MGESSTSPSSDRSRLQAPQPDERTPSDLRDNSEVVSASPIGQPSTGPLNTNHGLQHAFTTPAFTYTTNLDTIKDEHNDDVISASSIHAPSVPRLKSEAASEGNTTLNPDEKQNERKPIKDRVLAAGKRFVIHFKNALFHSWMNVLLLVVPVAIVVRAVNLSASIVFALNAIAIIPLAGLLTYATESVARRLGDTLGALLNVSFGNAVELIIFIIALVKNEIRIVQASLLGSILSNLLLILGMAFLLGGLRYREQIYNSTVTQMSACLLSLSVMSLLLPTAFHASFNEQSVAAADDAVLRISRGTSVILLLVYVLYLLFQLKSHAYLYESTPQAIIDEESHPGVLADVLGSSSSSDDSSSSSDDNSDTDGSVNTTSKKRRRRMFRRRRRKSSASASVTTRSSAVTPGLSSPSTTERHDPYWEAQMAHASTRRPELGTITSGNESGVDLDASAPRVRDFVARGPSNTSAEDKSPVDKRGHRKQKKSSRGTRNHDGMFEVSDAPSRAQEEYTQAHEPQHAENTSDQRPIAPSGRLAVTMRQLSTRAAFRPSLPKMLSNNVFVQADPTMPATQTTLPTHSMHVGSTLRRTSSLPDRLGFHQPPAANATPYVRPTTGPLPPYQHTRPFVASRRPDLSPGDGEADGADGEPLELSRTAAVVLLLISTALVAVCAEFMVDAIPTMLENNSGISQAFVGLIILPVVSNAAEHVTAVTVAAKNKMDLAIGVAVGSSIQIALFVTPIVVLLGWILKTDMSLYFNLFETISLFVTAFVVNFLVLDGRSNYLEGSLLIAAYVIIAVGAFYYPSDQNLSSVGGGAQ